MKTIGFVTSPLTDQNAVRGVGFYTKNLLANLKLLAPKHNMEIIETINYQLSTINYDLLHIPYFTPYSLSIPSGIKIPLVVTIHDVTPLEFPGHYPPGLRGWLNLQIQKHRLRQASRIITDSFASVKSIHHYLQVPNSKIRFIHLAADPIYHPITDRRILSQVKAKYHLPDKFVLYVGDVNWNKNLPGLTAACLTLKVPLVVVGKQARELESSNLNHPELVHLKDWFTDKNVIRLGFVPTEELAVIYYLAAVYCQPSFAEGFGIPVLEALASGTPVACSQIPSLLEIAGEAALYFDPGKQSEMTKVLHQLLIDSRLRSRLRLQGPAQSAKFSWAKTAAQTLQVYRELLD